MRRTDDDAGDDERKPARSEPSACAEHLTNGYPRTIWHPTKPSKGWLETHQTSQGPAIKPTVSTRESANARQRPWLARMRERICERETRGGSVSRSIGWSEVDVEEEERTKGRERMERDKGGRKGKGRTRMTIASAAPAAAGVLPGTKAPTKVATRKGSASSVR